MSTSTESTQETSDAAGRRLLRGRWSEISLSAITMGVLMALIGYTSSFAIVLQGLREAGADERQAASGLMALCIGMGLSGIWLSVARRQPISVAWSTPGAALLIASGGVLTSFNAAVGAFLVSALLLCLAGWVRPLGRLMTRIPASLANAMLAGILLPICLSPIEAISAHVWLALPVVLAWWLIGRINRLAAVPGAILVLMFLAWWRLELPDDLATRLIDASIPSPVLVAPIVELDALISIAIPLFIVTMASQNIPGMAVLRANGFRPEAGPLIANTGIFTAFSAPFGAHAINLAALTAAMCAGPDAHADPARRYWAAIVAGVSYVLIGLLAGVVGLLVTLVPVILIEAIAGLALIGAFTASLLAAFAEASEREAAAVCFLTAGSGVVFLGVGGAFWGLLAGGVMLLSSRLLRRSA